MIESTRDQMIIAGQHFNNNCCMKTSNKVSIIEFEIAGDDLGIDSYN